MYMFMHILHVYKASVCVCVCVCIIVLATSGIDYNVKIWEPVAAQDATLSDLDEVHVHVYMYMYMQCRPIHSQPVHAWACMFY